MYYTYGILKYKIQKKLKKVISKVMSNINLSRYHDPFVLEESIKTEKPIDNNPKKPDPFLRDRKVNYKHRP